MKKRMITSIVFFLLAVLLLHLPLLVHVEDYAQEWRELVLETDALKKICETEILGTQALSEEPIDWSQVSRLDLLSRLRLPEGAWVSATYPAVALCMAFEDFFLFIALALMLSGFREGKCTQLSNAGASKHESGAYFLPFIPVYVSAALCSGSLFWLLLPFLFIPLLSIINTIPQGVNEKEIWHLRYYRSVFWIYWATILCFGLAVYVERLRGFSESQTREHLCVVAVTLVFFAIYCFTKLTAAIEAFRNKAPNPWRLYTFISIIAVLIGSCWTANLYAMGCAVAAVLGCGINASEPVLRSRLRKGPDLNVLEETDSLANALWRFGSYAWIFAFILAGGFLIAADLGWLSLLPWFYVAWIPLLAGLVCAVLRLLRRFLQKRRWDPETDDAWEETARLSPNDEAPSRGRARGRSIRAKKPETNERRSRVYSGSLGPGSLRAWFNQMRFNIRYRRKR